MQPVVARGVHPPDVVPTVRRPTLVRDHPNQLIVPGVQALTVRTVEDFVVELVLEVFLALLISGLDNFLFLLLLLGLVLHLDVGPGEALGVLLFAETALEVAAQVKGLLELLRAELVDIECLRETDVLWLL